MKIMVIDVGGTSVKVYATTQPGRVKIASGPEMTPEKMVAKVKEATRDWDYSVISIGYPGPVVEGRIIVDPANLGPGWVGFDFESAFDRPVHLINDAAMQAIGSYAGDRMLFLSLGTGLGSAWISDGVLLPLELSHLPYKKGRSFEDYLGVEGMRRRGHRRWQQSVFDVVERFLKGFEPDYVVLGGGNAKLLDELPPCCRLGDNTHAFRGGCRMWDEGFRRLNPRLF